MLGVGSAVIPLFIKKYFFVVQLLTLLPVLGYVFVVFPLLPS